LNGNVFLRKSAEADELRGLYPSLSHKADHSLEEQTARNRESAADSSLHLVRPELSRWSCSAAKRVFDCACVVLTLPLLIPVLLAVALAVRISSRGPILFLQKRMGRHGQPFTIFKFRTLVHAADKAHHAVTTAANQRFTPVGRFLRRWKLDELPQIANVLLGEMSLVGPRPKLPEHVISDIPCRPGITGAATIAFAREELVLARVPKDYLEFYYRTIVLPAKHDLDAEYMARATFLSDVGLIFDSVLRRWHGSILENLLEVEALDLDEAVRSSGRFDSAVAQHRWNRTVDLPDDADAPVVRRARNK
jgi:lipopolysaccharide/colanic/teichoic acid biosynthesis glycosyltransferase